MENHSWSSIHHNPSAAYIDSLLELGAHTRQYKCKSHPSETNYIWLEAADNLGVKTDDPATKNHQGTHDHLVSQLDAKGVSWRFYAEGTDGRSCPLKDHDSYAQRHVPGMLFDDVTEHNNPNSQRCIAHVRPYEELEGDLSNNSVARYNFITPNLCHDMHGPMTMCHHDYGNMIVAGDQWLSREVPKILNSQAFKDGGALFITWDEGDEPEDEHAPASDGPIGMIVLSPYAKKLYGNDLPYDHSSTVRTMETIFGVPFLRGAKSARDLGDLFQP
jgi:phospholipase C